MDQEQLSGEIASACPPSINNHNFVDDQEDFDDINFNEIEDYAHTNMNHRDDGQEEKLSDYDQSEKHIQVYKTPMMSKINGKGMKMPFGGYKTPITNRPMNGNFRGKNKQMNRDSDEEDPYEQEELSNRSETEGMKNSNFKERNMYQRLQEQQQRTINQFEQRKKANKLANQDQLSDYEDQQQDEVSQYHNSLFGDLQSNHDMKSSMGSFPQKKFNSSNNNVDALSDDVKQSQRTNDIIAKRDTKRELMNKFKAEKRQKFNENSASFNNDDKPMAISKREKVENKKRFSKKQLQLVSRKFSDYYAYETNRQYRGNKITLRQIGQMFQLGHATIHKLYAQWMDDPYFYERIKRYDRYRKQTKNPERKLTLDRLEHITRLIKQNPFLTQYQLCVELNKIEDLKVIKCGQRQNMTRTIVGKLLRMGKFRKKRVKCIPKQKNTSKSLEKRHQYCIKYKEILQRRAKVYFLDESGFNLYMTRDKAWSRPNEEITVNCPISKGKRFSLIAIIGDDGLAHWRFIQGNYRKFEYLDFIRQLFQKINQHKSVEDPQEKWIVMDNCAIHDKQQTINLAKQHGINVLYLPSYSPQLNPIENWFHEIKCKLKKINYSGEKQLFNIMQRILKQYQVHDFSNYYHGSLKFVEKGLKKQKF